MNNNRPMMWLVAFAFGLLLTGCYPHREVGLLQERGSKDMARPRYYKTGFIGPRQFKDTLPVYDSAAYVPYRLQVNDEIIYRVLTMDETVAKTLLANNNNSYNTQYANSYRIYSDGTVDLPFMEPIKLEGLTELEAQDTVRKYMRELIPDADVKLALYNKQFTILGDASSGVRYIYKDRMTIFQALALTGDFMKSADRRHVRIIRPHGNGKPEVLEFDIRPKSIIDSKYYYIYPNDLIYVSREPGSFFKQESYGSFIAIIMSSVSLLISVLNYIPNVGF
ncbi:MAG: polysaccharide biosynthesis/export family protein [Paludibacteraceae bacterium]|nr:polysaccharide biosynthesis/export family protein [Paludibacteraceae bacterium]